MACVDDGPNDENEYAKASLKIIHLLKQPTQDSGSLPQLVKQIVRDSNLGRKFMYRLALRSYGLLNKFAPWEEVKNQEPQVLGEALLQSGIVNVVNDKFASNTKLSDLYKWAREYKQRWHKRILKWQPQLVVCGGTFSAIREALNQQTVEVASTGMRWFKDPQVDKCVYLDAPHPTARYPVAMVHTYLMASAREIWEKV